MSTIPTPGAYLVLDGISRVITNVNLDRNKVFFDNPPSAPKPTHQSRAGTCAFDELVSLELADQVVWTLPGRMEAKPPRPEAVQMESAAYLING